MHDLIDKRQIIWILLFYAVTCHAQSPLEYVSPLAIQLVYEDSTQLKKQYNALKRAEASADFENMSKACYAMGNIYYFHGLVSLELKSFLAATGFAEKTRDTAQKAKCYSDLGRFYKNRGDSLQAMKYLLKALDNYTAMSDTTGVGYVYNGMGDVYESKHNYPAAMNAYTKSLQILEETKDSSTLIWPLFNIGETYMLKGMHDSALTYYLASLYIQQKVEDKSAEAYTYNNIGGMLLKERKYKIAEEYLVKSLAISTALREIAGMRRTNTSLSELYEATGNYKKAFVHHKAVAEENAILFSKENTGNIVKLQMQHDFDHRQEMEQIKQANNRLHFNILVAFLALISIVASGAYYLQRRGSKLKGALLLQQEKLIEQKELLMKEIHHRIKNNLQVISTLLDLEMMHMTDHEAKNVITDSSGRLKAISLIHHQLYDDDGATDITVAPFITDLHKQVRAVFHRPGQQVLFSNEVSTGVMFDVDTAVPIGLMVNELMTNSYKYAFSPDGGTIGVSIKAGNQGDYTLYYQDSGSGLPPDYDIGQSKGIGMKLIHSLSKQLHGTFIYSYEDRQFIVTFKDIIGRKMID